MQLYRPQFYQNSSEKQTDNSTQSYSHLTPNNNTHIIPNLTNQNHRFIPQQNSSQNFNFTQKPQQYKFAPQEQQKTSPIHPYVANKPSLSQFKFNNNNESSFGNKEFTTNF